MSSNNSINSSTFTEIELSVIAVALYLFISPIHGVSKITKPLLKMLNVKTPTSLLLFTGLLFGVIYYFLIKFVLGPLYKKMRMQRFKVGGQSEAPEAETEVETYSCPLNTPFIVAGSDSREDGSLNCVENCPDDWVYFNHPGADLKICLPVCSMLAEGGEVQAYQDASTNECLFCEGGQQAKEDGSGCEDCPDGTYKETPFDFPNHPDTRTVVINRCTPCTAPLVPNSDKTACINRSGH